MSCWILNFDDFFEKILQSRLYMGKDPFINIYGGFVTRSLYFSDRIKEIKRTRNYFSSTKSNDYIYRKKNKDGTYTRYPPARILLEEARDSMYDNHKTNFKHIYEISDSIPLTKRIDLCEELNQVLNRRYKINQTKMQQRMFAFSSVLGINGFKDSNGKEVIFLIFFKSPVPIIKSSSSEKEKKTKIIYYLRNKNNVSLFFTYKSNYEKMIEYCKTEDIQNQLNMEEYSSKNKKGNEVVQMGLTDYLDDALENLDNSINMITFESTASDVSDKMEYIRDEILVMRQRLQEARENKDINKVKKICDNGIITLKKYYKEIEDIPETLWENVGMGVLRNVVSLANVTVSLVSLVMGIRTSPKNIKTKISMVGSGLSITSELVTKLKNSIDSVNYKKINDKYFGNKNRKGFGNEVKEKALKMINDNILILQKVRNEI